MHRHQEIGNCAKVILPIQATSTAEGEEIILSEEKEEEDENNNWTLYKNKKW